ncbi:MAG: CoA-binding protein [Chloroflexi bacterium]|nr:CoA-binding protein [Chloroflexota bacterium]
MNHMNNLDLLFHPRSVAVIGATDQVWGGGGLMLKNIMMNAFPGPVYPVHPSKKQIAGLPAYASVLDVPGEVDLAVIAIPAAAVPAVIDDCSRKAVKFAVIHSSGFAELDGNGKMLEDEMVGIASKGGPRIIGPNSMGVYSPAASLNTVITYETIRHEPGPIAFVGQSGWGTENFVRVGMEQGLRFSKVVSIGNQCDLTIEDLLEYFGADPETRVVGGYLEGVKRPGEFLRLAAEVSRRKPVVLWKGSRTEAAALASVSHTGAMATNQAVFEAGLKQSGVIMATGLRELINLALALTCPVPPRGDRVGLLVSSGAVGIASCDAVESLGLKLAVFPEGLKKQLYDYLIPMTSLVPNVSNPVDMGWLPAWGSAEPYLKCLEMVLAHSDMVLFMCFTPLDERLLEGLRRVQDAFRKPIVVMPGHPLHQRAGMELLSKNGFPAYAYPEDAIKALASLWQYARWVRSQNGSPLP